MCCHVAYVPAALLAAVLFRIWQHASYGIVSELSTCGSAPDFAYVCGQPLPLGGEARTQTSDMVCGSCRSDAPFMHEGRCVAACPIAPAGCNAWFDGCNECAQNEHGLVDCILRDCVKYDQPACRSDTPCANGKVWNSCGSPLTLTCANLVADLVAPTVCVPRCECSRATPYEDAFGTCIGTCGSCPENCSTWFDGCNECSCLAGASACTRKMCNVYQAPYCKDT